MNDTIDGETGSSAMSELESLGGWPAVLRIVTAGADLDEAMAHAAMSEILAGGAAPAQIAGLVIGLRTKGETVAELSGFLRAMLDVVTPVPIDADALGLVDTCGTGGDGSHSINVSTIAALVVAGAGGRVCKHGNRGASSKCGSADLLAELGVRIDAPPEVVAECVRAAGIGFCFAPAYHGAMRHAGPTRRELGVPTAFNYLGPLANPARVRRQIVGVSDPAMAERMLEVLAAGGARRAMIVHGDDGLDELTVTTTSSVLELRDGERTSWKVDPSELGLALASSKDLVGGDAAENAAHARRVLDGTAGPHRDVVVLNAAAALVVGDVVADLAAGVEAAGRSIDEGAAARALDDLVRVSQS
ncbi:MAG: anthranilate phosphoribosyltransferase [Actinomycetota bacterium]|nr:anthranilate phosphoribosyltransferase [Actinomycetota bacterium]